VAAAAVTAWVAWRGAPSVTGSLLGGAAIFLAFLVFNKAAHANYYWFADALLSLAIMTSAAESAPAERPPQ
jgi:hypothetical protein